MNLNVYLSLLFSIIILPLLSSDQEQSFYRQTVSSKDVLDRVKQEGRDFLEERHAKFLVTLRGCIELLDNKDLSREGLLQVRKSLQENYIDFQTKEEQDSIKKTLNDIKNKHKRSLENLYSGYISDHTLHKERQTLKRIILPMYIQLVKNKESELQDPTAPLIPMAYVVDKKNE